MFDIQLALEILTKLNDIQGTIVSRLIRTTLAVWVGAAAVSISRILTFTIVPGYCGAPRITWVFGSETLWMNT